MNAYPVTDAVTYVGADDPDLALFEGQHPVRPIGVSYNSYVITDQKIAVMDTVDARVTEAWLENLDYALDGRTPDYLIISHMEPDHAANIARLAALYPEMKLVGNAKTFVMLRQFFGPDAAPDQRLVTVGEGDVLELGSHRLRFFLAPMVHWPEVMVTYEESEKLLFSADAFGRFGALSLTEKAPWAPQARRYYLNIVGKYGAQVQALLKKLASLPVEAILPLHGPVLTQEIGRCLELYDLWSSYRPEEPDRVLVAYASIYGHTKQAALALADLLTERGADVTTCDLTTTHVSDALTQAFCCGKLVLASVTYDGGLFPPMEELLNHLKAKNFQNRKIGLMENGSWAPQAARLMRARLEEMKNLTLCPTAVSLRSALNEGSRQQLQQLADELLAP